MSTEAVEAFVLANRAAGKLPKSEAVEAVTARHVPATRRRLSFFYVLRSLDGTGLASFADMHDAWLALSDVPDARELVDDAGRLLAFRGKWVEAGAEIDPANVTERAGERRVRR